MSRDGRTFVHSGRNRCHVRDPLAPDTVLTTARYRANWEYLALTPDGKILALANWGTRGIALRDAVSGKGLRAIGTNASMQLGGYMVFSPDGRWLAATYRPDIIVWRTADWTPAWKVKREDEGAGLAFTPDSRLLAARCDKGEMRLFAVESGQVLATYELPGGDLLNGMHFSPDGRQLAVRAYFSGQVFMFDLPALRARLATMSLDWDLPPSPPPAVPETSSLPISLAIDPGPAAAK